MAGVNVVAAETDEEARRLFTTLQQAFTDLHRGARGLMKAPIDDIEGYWTPAEKIAASRMLACSVVGSPETVRAGIEAFVERTKADELMIVTTVFDNQARKRSYAIVADAFGLTST
jgi:alkanesulfonate monooxygenase SsuD/methylene tetrahydromethanopterin reductase-like flavin-dependent oxidoreductase (luciferase family)